MVAKAFGFPSRFVGVAVDVEGIGEVTSARDNGERGRVVTFDVDGGEDESGCVGDDDDGGEVFGESGEETPSVTFDPVGGKVKVSCVVCCPVGICVVAGCCCGGGFLSTVSDDLTSIILVTDTTTLVFTSIDVKSDNTTPLTVVTRGGNLTDPLDVAGDTDKSRRKTKSLCYLNVSDRHTFTHSSKR